MKLEMFILGRNSILMRVENIGDIFNSEGEIVYQQVNIKELAQGLFTLVNSCTVGF